MIRPLLLKTKSHALNALNDANKKISQLNKVILVGGSTKSSFVRNFIKKEFGDKTYHDIDPDLTVSYGAAKLADSISTKSQDGALLIDVTPLSLGIEVKGGIMNKIIPRNTTIPVSVAQDYITAEDNQESVIIKIYQGERPLAQNNEFLGEFELTGFEKRPKGQTIIVVKFEIDTSGLIIVSAFDKISGLQSNVTLKSLTSDRINQLLDDLDIQQDDKKLELELELQSLQSTAKTLLLTKQLSNDNSYSDTYNSLKDNLPGLKVFIQELQEL
jgi:molecular chaperone DnaK